MDPLSHPEPPDLALLLPRDAYYQLVHSLRGLLPPPVTDTPEDEARRDNAAIAQVACLLPASAAEATLGASSSPPTPTRRTACAWPASSRAMAHSS
jgi:hypothetical protein